MNPRKRIRLSPLRYSLMLCDLLSSGSANVRRHAVSVLTVVAAIVLLFSTAALASDLSSLTSKRPSGAPLLAVHGLNRIKSALESEGSVRVIVRVVPPAGHVFRTEGEIEDKEKVGRQRAAIARQQEKVAASALAPHKRQSAKRFQFIPFMAMEVDQAELEALAASPDIDLIEEDTPVRPTLSQSVPLVGGTGGAFGGFTGSGQTIAILDTGVDKTHPFLTEKVVSEACYSTTYKAGGATAVCVDGSTAAGSGVNCSLNVDGCDHGTHVAGIAAGKGSTFSGVAKDATLIAIQVFSEFQASKCGVGATGPCAMSYDSDQISGLQRVYDLRNTFSIASANMSLGGGSYTTYCDSANVSLKAAIDNLRSVGIATVIASGNEYYTTSISEPACISTAVSVGATDKSDRVASYSNSAYILNLLAPGSSIYSSVPGGGYLSMSGTSMATPHVAGAWAVLKQVKPTASVSEVLAALTSTGPSVTDTRNGITKPRIKVDAAVNYLKPAPVTYTVAVTRKGSGVGTVSAQSVGISCGSSCSATVSPGTTVTLTALPAAGSTFTGWSGGGCSGTTNPCVSTIGSNTSVEASFETGMTIASESFSDPSMPPGWTVLSNAAGGSTWRFDNPGGRGNDTGGTGTFAIADAQYPQDLAVMDTEMRSPSFDFTGFRGASISFKTGFPALGDSTADVDVTNDGGVTWQNVWRKTGSNYSGPATESVDVSAYAAGRPDVRFRFHYYTANHGSYWEVDDFTVSGSATFVVTASVTGARGSVSSTNPLSVNGGLTATFTTAPDFGYTNSESVGGTCPQGSFNQNTYTTGPITGDCTVTFSFVPLQFTISTAVSGAGSISCTPATTVVYDTFTSCTAVPDSGNYISAAYVDNYPQPVTNPVLFTHTFGPIRSDHSMTATFLQVSTPDPPVIGVATAGNGQATLAFSPPASTGGSAITSYTVVSSPGGITASGIYSPITVTGLTNGTTYTFTVSATNSSGTSQPSAPSNSVTPTLGPQNLSVNLSGTGSGSVVSSPAGISCGPGATGGCNENFSGNSLVSLTATPSWDSIFTGWSGDCTGTSCTVRMDGPKSVYAAFDLKQNVTVGTSTFSSLQTAYEAAPPEGQIQLEAATFVENVILDRPVTVTLDGGKDSTTGETVGLTTIKGSLTVRQGTAVINAVAIQ